MRARRSRRQAKPYTAYQRKSPAKLRAVDELKPVEEPLEKTVAVQEPAEGPVDGPVQDPVGEPVEKTVEEPPGNPIEEQFEEPPGNPVEEQFGEPVGSVSKTKWRSFLDAAAELMERLDPCLGWLWTLRAPLLLLFLIGMQPKLVFLWVLIIIAKPVSCWVYSQIPDAFRNKVRLSLPPNIRNSALFRDFNEGADHGLPFVLFWLYIFCAPFAIVWMAVHWLRGFARPAIQKPRRDGSLVFAQNRRRQSAHAENNFHYSRAFGIVVFSFFALGIPAFFSYAVFENSGIEQAIDSSPAVPVTARSTPAPPYVELPRVGLASRPRSSSLIAPNGSDATVVMGYNGFWPFISSFGLVPNKYSVFFVHFYLVSLATAISVLFFRAWFLFPLNFLTDEHDVEFTASGVKRKALKGWFLNVLTLNRWATGGGADSLLWNEVKSVRYQAEGYTKLCPLPETAFQRESLTYKLLNKGAAFIDGVSSSVNTGRFLVFSSSDRESDFGRNIKVNLNELNREERAKLFYAVKQWAPHVVIRPAAEEQMIGSNLPQNPRYTQIWFDMLTSRTALKRRCALSSGDILRNGEYTVEERIAAGGQATTYLATRQSGEKCVLKEFILAASSGSGALIESAREFEAEISLLSQLHHPGIVKLEDFFADDGRVYAVLEHIEGRSLRQMIQDHGQLTEAEVARIAASVCDVLEYMHGLNPPVVHRDITPENILVKPDGTIKVIDFSLAARQDGRGTTDSCAKQAFTPPEQFQEQVCTQSDIYALGATMHFCLTGATPKPISSSSPRAKSAHVSEEMSAIVERATQIDLSGRYESVHWLKLELDAMQASAGKIV